MAEDSSRRRAPSESSRRISSATGLSPPRMSEATGNAANTRIFGVLLQPFSPPARSAATGPHRQNSTASNTAPPGRNSSAAILLPRSSATNTAPPGRNSSAAILLPRSSATNTAPPGRNSSAAILLPRSSATNTASPGRNSWAPVLSPPPRPAHSTINIAPPGRCPCPRPAGTGNTANSPMRTAIIEKLVARVEASRSYARWVEESTSLSLSARQNATEVQSEIKEELKERIRGLKPDRLVKLSRMSREGMENLAQSLYKRHQQAYSFPPAKRQRLNPIVDADASSPPAIVDQRYAAGAGDIPAPTRSPKTRDFLHLIGTEEAQMEERQEEPLGSDLNL